MDEKKRLALALQYQQQKPAWWDAVPDVQSGTPIAPPQMSWLDRLNEFSAGTGKGIENQLAGYNQMLTHPIDTAQEMYQSGKAIVQDPKLLVQGLKAMGEKAVGSPAGFGEVVGENLNPRNLLRNLAKPTIAEITTYHGTPHRFPPTERNPLGEFDSSKIGTGEGAQAYGHGIYLAENPSVAGGYRNVLAETLDVFGDATPLERRAAQMALTFGGNTIKGANAWLSKFDGKGANHLSPAMTPELVQSVKEKFKNGIFRQGGSLYHVDLPDEKIDRMLDWDKPLSEQSESVRKALGISDGYSFHDLGASGRMTLHGQSMTGNDLLAEMKSLLGENNKPAASEYLRSIGIPGIKYLDAGSRDGGKGTRNFVIFPGEEKDLKILERK